jgi:predicted membrane metal-binding protein
VVGSTGLGNFDIIIMRVGVSMKMLLSGLNSLLVGGCCAALLVFLGVNLDKRPWWSWIVAAIAFGVIWEFAKSGIAKSVADRMGSGAD